MDEVLKNVANGLASRFIQRKDVKAMQRPNGDWFPVKEPWTRADLEAHLSGAKTFGHYMVDHDDQCKLFTFDIDFVKAPTFFMEDDGSCIPIIPRDEFNKQTSRYREFLTIQLRCLAECLAIRTKKLLDIDVAMAYSGNKGIHVYGFTGPVKASETREAAHAVLESFGSFEPVRGDSLFAHVAGQSPNDGYQTLNIEIYPKQDSLQGKEFGNLNALPLGIHQATGNRKFFITDKAGYNELRQMDSLEALTSGLAF